VSVVCNAVDDVLLRSGDIRDQVAKLRRNFDVLGPPNFGEKVPPKFLTEFYKSESLWQSLVTIGQGTSEIMRRKKVNSKRQQ